MAESGMNEEKREPGWLTAKVDQRLAFMLEMTGGQFPAGALVMTPLTEPGDDASAEERERWERACDNCGAFVPNDQNFVTGQCVRNLNTGHQAIITFGSCQTCWER